MKELWKNKLYRSDLQYIAALPLDWARLAGRTVVLSGATGMIGRFLVDALLYKNEADRLGCRIAALGRDVQKARRRFPGCAQRPDFAFYSCDILQPATLPVLEKADFIFHLASSTHPVAYATDPIGTVTANVVGTQTLLELAARTGTERFVFASSVEIYGENRGDVERFAEDYNGYLDCNTVRAGYPESKRCGEALCQAYIAQKGLDAVIPRLPRTFGPTMQMSDSKAIAQFIKKGLAREEIVLKSKGGQLYSYAYVADAAAGLLYCLLKGECGQAYNIADPSCDITLKELAGIAARYAGKSIVFDIPDAVESAGYSKSTKALLDSAKLRALGWRAQYDIQSGMERTLEILAFCDSGGQT